MQFSSDDDQWDDGSAAELYFRRRRWHRAGSALMGAGLLAAPLGPMICGILDSRPSERLLEGVIVASVVAIVLGAVLRWRVARCPFCHAAVRPRFYLTGDIPCDACSRHVDLHPPRRTGFDPIMRVQPIEPERSSTEPWP